MKNTLSLLAILLFSAISVKAQNQNQKSAFAVAIGASANYYYGPGDRNFDSFEGNRVNYQLTGMVGLTIARDKNDHRTMVAAFGDYGLNNKKTMERIFDDQGYITTALDQGSSNNFYEVEGGVLLGEILRLSTGVGRQIYNEQTIASSNGIDFQSTQLNYYSSTVGFNFAISNVAIVLNCNFNYGKDYTTTVIKPSAGLTLNF
ncbi:MAG TPA: hypothetical protein VGP55_16685 [Chitinophagaceae bacterium]|nr:hypothetical protein [Chitinophagaceae bacterium]